MITKDFFPKSAFEKIVRNDNANVNYFHFDITEEDEMVTCSTASIIGNYAKDELTSACIATKYPLDAQMALLYNYQSDPEKYAEEMQTYQTWRAYCKQAVKEFYGE